MDETKTLGQYLTERGITDEEWLAEQGMTLADFEKGVDEAMTHCVIEMVVKQKGQCLAEQGPLAAQVVAEDYYGSPGFRATVKWTPLGHYATQKFEDMEQAVRWVAAAFGLDDQQKIKWHLHPDAAPPLPPNSPLGQF